MAFGKASLGERLSLSTVARLTARRLQSCLMVMSMTLISMLLEASLRATGDQNIDLERTFTG